ncbi:MAG: enoyl-CoA hydratase-related protein [Chloroflexi bacterium]|nr:enoyl-CoA hydratase-related protein [Chloroflexota bacterium]
MSFDFIRSETREGVLLLTLNDPKTRNAMGAGLGAEMESELDRFAADPALRVLVLTGQDPAFCSGANLRGFNRTIEEREERAAAGEGPAVVSPWEQLDPAYMLEHGGMSYPGPSLVRKLHNLQKPSIAAVNGPAYGFGCGLALACDIRFASEQARFSEAFVRMGATPADGSCWYLPKLIGLSNALLLQYTGDAIDGAEAARIGLVSKVLPHGQLLDTTMELATRLAQQPPYSMALIKLLMHKAFEQSLPEHLALAGRALALARSTEDHKEGIRAFLEKRKAVFSGR